MHAGRKPEIIKPIAFKRSNLIKLNRIITGENGDIAMDGMG